MRRHIYYTLQSLLHKQGSNAIKIVSLALGLLMSVFLFARIAFELSFDNFYHDSDNLYIVKTGWLKMECWKVTKVALPSFRFRLPLPKSFRNKWKVVQ